MADKSLIDFDAATQLSPTDLLYIGVTDQSVVAGFKDGRTTLSIIANALLNSFGYQQDLETTDKTIIGAINELKEDMPSVIENVVFPVPQAQGGNE